MNERACSHKIIIQISRMFNTKPYTIRVRACWAFSIFAQGTNESGALHRTNANRRSFRLLLLLLLPLHNSHHLRGAFTSARNVHAGKNVKLWWFRTPCGFSNVLCAHNMRAVVGARCSSSTSGVRMHRLQSVLVGSDNIEKYRIFFFNKSCFSPDIRYCLQTNDCDLSRY